MDESMSESPVMGGSSVPARDGEAGRIADEQEYRAGAYTLLAALLRSAPDAGTLDRISRFGEAGAVADELELSMAKLGLAARSCDREGVRDEYHALFIGLGRGELVPYGSWYLTGFLMEKPLGELRDDLAKLGFERDEGVHEPEDHAAALCEVMAMLIAEGGVLVDQKQFFNAHIGSWMAGFFDDLTNAKTATFYGAAGRFGAAFMEFEQRYLVMEV